MIAKKGDFEALGKVAEQLAEQLKTDEKSPDLRAQFDLHGSVETDHKYFLEPYRTEWSPMLEHKAFIPMPVSITEQYDRVSCASFMGILPEINRAWITVDSRLYLWDYMNPSDYLQYDGLNEVIVSIGLAVPRAGVFTDVVKYILVIATPVEIVLLAVTWNEDKRHIRLQHTKYAIPSDDVTMLKIVCAQSGRVFMAGNDGNLYELIYENLQDSWATYLGVGEPHKCRKINHSAWNIVNVVPPVVKEFVGWDDTLVDVVVDNLRSLLFTRSARGNINMFFLGTNESCTQCVVSNFNVFQKTRDFLSRRSGSTYPDARQFNDDHNLMIVSMHVVSLFESKSVNLLLVLSSGVRVYLSTATDTFSSSAPNTLSVAHVRTPPMERNTLPATSVGGMTPLSSSAVRVDRAFYSHGVMLASGRFSNTQVGREENTTGQDTLLGLTEDLICRDSVRGLQPSLREAVSLITTSRQQSAAGASGSSRGRVHDIKESCPQLHGLGLSRIQVLSSLSRTAPNESRRVHVSGNSNYTVLGVAKDVPPNPPPGSAPCLSYAHRPPEAGVPLEDMHNICQLNEFAWTHLPVPSAAVQRQLLCLTNQGMHVINKLRPVDYLMRILSMRGTGHEYLSAAQSFFGHYGAVQSCAMCVGIACGLPGDAGGGEGIDPSIPITAPAADEVRRRAVSIMLQLGGAASFRRNKVLGWAPNVADITYSQSYDAITLFASRVLRPIWFREIIFHEKHSGSSVSGNVIPAKNRLKFLLSQSDMNSIRQPLIQLLGVLREYFASAIRRPPQETSRNAPTNSVQTGKANVIVRQLGMNSRARDAEVTREIDAKRQEEAAYNALYRLLSRSCQALSLFDILLSAERNHNISINWSDLNGKMFSDIVTTAAAHESVKRLVNGALQDQSSSSRTTHVADEITLQLSRFCYLWFSRGDKFLYEGLKALMAGHTAPAGSSERASYVTQAGGLLCQAARYWRSLNDVEGEKSILWSTCAQLITLGGNAPERVVDLCVSASENFGGGKGSSDSHHSLMSAFESGAESEEWEKDLYHGGGVFTSEERLRARKDCYECLLNEIKRVRVSADRLGGGVVTVDAGQNNSENSQSTASRMIAYALATSDDKVFHEQLYEDLYKLDSEQLVYIQSRHIENFLREKDALILYRHYVWHGRHAQAAFLMDLLAHREEDTEIDTRIEHLIRAVNSANRACNTADTTAAMRVGVESAEVLANYSFDKVEDLTGKLQIAELQREVSNTLRKELQDIDRQVVSQEGKRQRDQLADIVHRLRYQLVDVSELYNNVTEPYMLWESNLVILCTCKHDDPGLAKRLWKSIIYRIVPKKASDVDVQEFLDEQRRKSNVMVDKRRQRTSVRFESYDQWVPDLVDRVIDLGTKLRTDSPIYGNTSSTTGTGVGGRTCFPILTIVEELEEITAVAAGTVGSTPGAFDRGWVFRCMLRAGVTHGELLECYMDIIPRWGGQKPGKRLQPLSSAAAIAVEWARLTASYSSTSSGEARQFIVCARSGKMRKWLQSLSTDLNNLSGHTLSSGENVQLKVARGDVTDAEQRLTALLLV
mmetsp:Transcript_24760/g.36519  ORF Transcript_24760/g.36519 Transcript_24760/m.36519 type:complete len:1559 (+) Transcript_24760:131-4807(+)|eukprot:CAMPEP_0185040356 /NCGR_PEP_ID=MMETSP1103-20130426/38316_1 /TAXON_ID=36769 /ORGANISM="Paraphysomonas bandaiensis, Strain Caron Lab Isolate" /LENGTH=1558 /DNA_ID=CAMNT_0027579621 /DNA_START=37 /DNA_END=4713 /DNA_ORIENTATION=-